jgi:hypothetical protein
MACALVLQTVREHQEDNRDLEASLGQTGLFLGSNSCRAVAEPDSKPSLHELTACRGTLREAILDSGMKG